MEKEIISKNPTIIKEMFNRIAKRYDIANTLLSFGLHHLWKKKAVNIALKGDSCLDICCGSGDLLIHLHKKFPKVIGLDFSENMLSIAKERIRKNNIQNIQLIQGDALNLPFPNESFNAITVSFGVRNFANLDKGLSEIYRTLKKRGIVVILEFGMPAIFPVNIIYKYYLSYILPYLGGFISGDINAYKYLSLTSQNFPFGDNFLEKLKSNKFKDCQSISLSGGIAYIYTGKKLNN